MTQQELDFTAPIPKRRPRIDSGVFLTEKDQDRLHTQLGRVKTLMLDGEWRTLSEISETLGIPEASASAQLRHLRKPKFGGHTVERIHVSNGLYRYRLIA